MRRRAGAAAVACSLLGALLAGAALYQLHEDRPAPREFGAVYATSGPGPQRKAHGRAPGASPSATTSRAGSSARSPLAAADALTYRPRLLRIATLAVQAPIEPVTTRGGLLAVPDDISHVGWWTGSHAPGSSTGTSVLDGHVDSAAAGKGVFFGLARLRSGDLVTVVDDTGRHVAYRVSGRRVYHKTRGLPPSLFTDRGPPRLVLITCGGPFDTTQRSYRDNIVVFAEPR